MPPDNRRRPQPEEGPLHVVYEDDAVLVLDKPAGLVVHPTYRNWSGTLLNAVLWRLRDRVDAQPGILTRLDKDTSGLVVIGVTPEQHARMQRAMTAGRVRKEYLAVVLGVPDPPAGRIHLPLGRDPADRRRVIVRDDGAPCETLYDVVEVPRDSGMSVVRCELITGRTHQIRVHLAAKGWPIVGDKVYGTPDGRIGRQALHAWRLSFPHPATGQMMQFEARVPEDMRVLASSWE